MTERFRLSRNAELSTYKYLKTNINTEWSGVNVAFGFAQKAKDSLPVISFRLTDKPSELLEIGSTTRIHTFNFIIDFYCTSNAQRLDLSDYVESLLQSNWPYYEHSKTSGSQTEVETSTNGTMRTLEIIENSKIDADEDVDLYEKFRHTIIFSATTSNIVT